MANYTDKQKKLLDEANDFIHKLSIADPDNGIFSAHEVDSDNEFDSDTDSEVDSESEYDREIKSEQVASPETASKGWQKLLLTYAEFVKRFETLFNFNASILALNWLNRFAKEERSMMQQYLHSNLIKISLDLKPLVMPEKYPYMCSLYSPFKDPHAKSVFIHLTNTLRNHIDKFDAVYQEKMAALAPPSVFPVIYPKA